MQDPWVTFWTTVAGSGIVALVSVATLILTNRHNLKMKRFDFRREELDVASSAIQDARRTIDGLIRVAEMLSESDKLLSPKNVPFNTILNSIDELKRLRRVSESSLNRVIFTSPNGEVRHEAAGLDLAITAAIDEGMTLAVESEMAKDQSAQLVEQVEAADEQFRSFRSTVYRAYHGKQALAQLGLSKY